MFESNFIRSRLLNRTAKKDFSVFHFVYTIQDQQKGRVVLKILKQMAIIGGICLICDVVAPVLPISFPGNVIAMIVIFLLLAFKLLKESSIEEVGDFLLKNMPFFFIPSATAIIEKYELLEGRILDLVVICIFSTLITFLATYYTVCAVTKLQQKKGE